LQPCLAGVRLRPQRQEHRGSETPPRSIPARREVETAYPPSLSAASEVYTAGARSCRGWSAALTPPGVPPASSRVQPERLPTLRDRRPVALYVIPFGFSLG